MTTRRPLAVLALAALLVLALAPPARAQSSDVIDRAAEQLQSDPVYVDPQADPAPSDAEAEQIRDAIRDAAPETGAIYVAVLPEETVDSFGGDPDGVLETLGRAVDQPGTYLVVVGRQIRAGADETSYLDRGEAGAIAQEAADENQGGEVDDVILDFVDGLEAEATGQGGGGVSWVLLAILGLLLLGGGFLFLRARRARAERERAQMEELRGTVLEDLVNLDEANRQLDVDLRLVDAPREVKQDALTGVESYASASQAVDAARRPDDFQAATAAVEEGLYAVASARARLEGREPPERRLPCFFDPRHGPSVREVQWTPPGGQPREVPACAADAIRVEQGEEPISREVTVGGRRRPYWDAPAYYGPWAGGYYGANSGLLTGLLLGSWFGGGFGGWGGYGYGGGGDSGGGDYGGGGDFGGGFGGGDFGGGDFGGGGGDF